MKKDYHQAKTINDVLKRLDAIGINTSPKKMNDDIKSGKEVSCRIQVFANNDEEELKKLSLI